MCNRFFESDDLEGIPFGKKLVKDPDEISVLGLMEFDWKETSFDLEFLAVNSQF